MDTALPAAAQRVQDALAASGLDGQVRIMPDSTRTAEEAAAAIGTSVAQIAKSIVFRAMQSGRAVLVVTSGVNRVDERKVAALLGEPLGKADADFVRQKTGYAIGGVPPLAHEETPVVFLDENLFKFEGIWAAAGTPKAVFPLTPVQLAAITGATPADIRKA
jgi:prolyl-tRNA editing enzyme YbaK/EbsC (Cys-tRNA(Pro) deacylase)